MLRANIRRCIWYAVFLSCCTLMSLVLTLGDEKVSLNDADLARSRQLLLDTEEEVFRRLFGGSWVVIASSLAGHDFRKGGGDCYGFRPEDMVMSPRPPGELSPTHLKPVLVDVSKSPMHLDRIWYNRTTDKMIVIPGIFKIEDDNLVWASVDALIRGEGRPVIRLNTQGNYVERPVDFTPAKGKEILILRKHENELYQGPLPEDSPNDPGWVKFNSDLK